MQGSRNVTVGPITVGCISPEAKDLLEDIIEQWDEHKKQLPDKYQESIYSFAYWLVRWSGLVQCAASVPQMVEET